MYYVIYGLNFMEIGHISIFMGVFSPLVPSFPRPDRVALARAHTFANTTFVTISKNRELKREHFGIGFILIGQKLSML